MTALSGYQRIVIRGTGQGSEIWQTSFATVVTTPITSQAGLASYAATVEPIVNTWWTSVKTQISPLFKYTGVNLYQYQYPSTSAQFQANVDRAAVAGTAAAGGSPLDTACVVSLRTAVPGRSTRGRMYVPYHLAVASTDGMYGAGNVDVVANATKTLFSSILSSTPGGVVVVSRTHGTYELITSLVTDNKPDVQRRRENRMQPSYTKVLAFP